LTVPHKPDIERLIDFARGKLSPEESLAVLEELEKDPRVSRDLELILSLMGLSREEWEEREKPLR
jgi:anti-sigma factor RsiW